MRLCVRTHQIWTFRPLGSQWQDRKLDAPFYVVVQGSGMFFNGVESIPIKAGSFIFVPAGQEHRFESFSADFSLWVFFYGPEGGEREKSTGEL